MIQIKVCPVQYRIRGTKTFKKGIQIINRKTNTFVCIDIKTMEQIKVGGNTCDYYVTLESSEGNILFNFKER